MAGISYFSPAGLGGVELLSCPDAGFDFPPHFHQEYCIWFNTSGGEQYTQRGLSEILQPGSFGIVAPGDVHANRAVPHSERSLMTLYVHEARIQSVVRQLGARSISPGEFRRQILAD